MARSFSSARDETMIPIGLKARETQIEDSTGPIRRSQEDDCTKATATFRSIPNTLSEVLASTSKVYRTAGHGRKRDLGHVHPRTMGKILSLPNKEASATTRRPSHRPRFSQRYPNIKSMFILYTKAVRTFLHSIKLGSVRSGDVSSTVAQRALAEVDTIPHSFWHMLYEQGLSEGSIQLFPGAVVCEVLETTGLETLTRFGESHITVIGPDFLSQLAVTGYGLHDFAAWNWILSGKTAVDAISRLKLLNTCTLATAARFGRIPLFVFIQLLKRQDVSAHALALLIQRAWILLELRDSPEHHTTSDNSSRANSSYRAPQFPLDTFAIMVVRLLRHSRKVWPAACVNIASLWTTHAGIGLAVQREEHDEMNTEIRMRLAFCYNRILSVLALAPEERPYQSAHHRQRAQFMLIRRMNEFQPPLDINREGYRAVTRVQLAHSKTAQERKWADLKAISWPPWKEDKLGPDASIGVEHGISRASNAIHRMGEAGYGNRTWEKGAHILAGWDTDGSPTIQTRSISLPMTAVDVPLTQLEEGSETRRETLPSEVDALWAARIKATRTLQEAWSCFLACKDQGVPLTPQVYFVMFEKLVYNNKRVHHNPETQALVDEGEEEEHLALPGDGKEVAALSTPHNEAVSTREPLPTFLSLFEQMTHDQVHPSGRFLEFLLKHAITYAEGVAILNASDLSESMKGVLTLRNGEPSSDVTGILEELPLWLFAAYIEFICRSLVLPTHRNSYEKYQLLRHAFKLVNIRKPFYVPPWRSLFALLAQPGSIVEWKRHNRPQSVRKLQEACGLLECLDSMRLDLDFKGFVALLAIVQHAATASKRTIATARPKSIDAAIDAAQAVLDSALSIVKVRFSQMVQPTPEIHRVSDGPFQSSYEPSDAGISSGSDPPPLPKLVQVPHPTHLHAYVHFLGQFEDYDGLLTLVQWMSGCSNQILDEAKEYSNGLRSMRTCLTAIRVYVEQPLIGYDEAKEIPDSERERYRKSMGLLDSVRKVVENNEDLSPWPSDGEVDRYITRGELNTARRK
ncbi:MAG: hypothetical protein Q9218_007715 [Villophora microphyllina]